MDHQALPGWVRELFSALERRDALGFARFLTEDVTYVFGNAPAIHGRNATREMVAVFLEGVAGVQYELERSWVREDSLIVDGHVTYTRQDGMTLTVPFCHVCLRQGDRISDYRAYGNISALYA